jgi:hypothetical protein
LRGSEQAGLGGRRLDTQAFRPSGTDVDGVQVAALDTLQQGLAGRTVGTDGLADRQPADGGAVQELAAASSGQLGSNT